VDDAPVVGHLADGGGGQGRAGAGPADGEGALVPGQGVETFDAKHEIAGVGEIEVVAATRQAGLDQAERRLAIGLERAAAVDDKVGGQGGQLLDGVAVAVENGRLERRPARLGPAGAEGPGLVGRTAGDQQAQARLMCQQTGQPGAEDAVAADDEDGQAQPSTRSA
jgi:hypothetical protein